MKLIVKLLRPFSDIIRKNEIEIDFNGDTIEDLIELLINKHPKLKKEFYNQNNKLIDYICIFLNDKPINALNGMATKLKNEDQILFFIPLSGG
ncbi:MAG: MoaD family protein [Thermoplasmatales archaeon]|nr:MAG: MoaD family protein [Thermoplasmatales archaeon]